jgi:hypothetical protein
MITPGDQVAPSSDDSNNFLSALLWDCCTETMINENTPVTDFFTMHTFCPLSPVLYLFKPTVHVCTLTMAEDEMSAYSASSHGKS